MRPLSRTLVRIVAATILLSVPRVASADFLGLTAGEYDVVLNGSAALCGSDCLGTIYVPLTNVNLTSNFDWWFEIGGTVFDWTAPGIAAGVSPNGLNSCAVEGIAGASCGVTDSGTVPSLSQPPFLALSAVNGASSYAVILSDEMSARGSFEAQAEPASTVPEPSSGVLLLLSTGLWAGIRRACRRR